MPHNKSDPKNTQPINKKILFEMSVTFEIFSKLRKLRYVTFLNIALSQASNIVRSVPLPEFFRQRPFGHFKSGVPHDQLFLWLMNLIYWHNNPSRRFRIGSVINDIRVVLSWETVDNPERW